MANILVAVTGGIAAYKSCDLVSGLIKSGNDVRVLMTANAKNIITPLTLSVISKHPVMDDMWTERTGNVDHIEVAKWADAFVVYPATANMIGKMANGIADDLVSTVYLALPYKVVKMVFPAMNERMLKSKPVLRNIQTLEDDGCIVEGTEKAMLACGDVGEGAVIKPRDAVNDINESLSTINKEPL